MYVYVCIHMYRYRYKYIHQGARGQPKHLSQIYIYMYTHRHTPVDAGGVGATRHIFRCNSSSTYESSPSSGPRCNNGWSRPPPYDISMHMCMDIDIDRDVYRCNNGWSRPPP